MTQKIGIGINADTVGAERGIGKVEGAAIRRRISVLVMSRWRGHEHPAISRDIPR
jgi:hypothetical protein